MIAVTLRMPVDVVEDPKHVAPALGHSGYQPLMRANAGRSLRADLARLDDLDVEALVEGAASASTALTLSLSWHLCHIYLWLTDHT